MCLEFGRFLPESLVTTFIQNKVVVVRKICINFSRMLFRSLSVQGPPFTLFNRVGWLNIYDGKNVDIRFHGISNGVAASEANHIFLGILRGIFSRMIIVLVTIKAVLDLTGNMGFKESFRLGAYAMVNSRLVTGFDSSYLQLLNQNYTIQHFSVMIILDLKNTVD